MKKISFILLVLLCWSSMVSAQENNNRLRKKYRNLSFVKQEFEPASYFGMDQTLKSNFGAAFTVGRTFYLHKKPIAGLIRFGLDATWFDLNYTNYKLEYRWEDNYDEEEEPETSNFHQAEIGMQVGPSVTVNPVGKLTMSIDDFIISYFVTGGGISYGVIGLGVESRWGSCKFKSFGGGDSEEDEQEPEPGKSKFNGMRVYLSFRF